MTHITAQQIIDAKANDLAAVSAIIEATEKLVVQKAHRYATVKGADDYDLAEDLAQVGRIAIWESLATFEGSGPAEFMGYIDRALHAAMSEHRRAVACLGISRTAAKDFELALSLSAGDPYEAERVASTEVMGERRMSPEHARAARLSWHGAASFEMVVAIDPDGEILTLGEVVARKLGMSPDLVEPRDVRNYRRTVIRDQVHSALGRLSPRRAEVLRATHGIAPAAYCGSEHDDELGDELGMSAKQVQQARYRGGKQFAENYLIGARAW